MGSCCDYIAFADFTGQNCTEAFDVCDGACENGGNCTEIAGGHYYNCSCPTGYTGYRCDVRECQNNGIAISGSSGTECMCPPGYSGSHCEDYDVCAAAPCSNHTRPPHCMPSPTNSTTTPGYVCICADGWEGEHCDVDRTLCPISRGEQECRESWGGGVVVHEFPVRL